jgi:hypothetical protein
MNKSMSLIKSEESITPTEAKVENLQSDYEFHELANVFPLMQGPELQALAADIQVNGLQHPILTYKGKIIDGRNRYRACKEIGIEPETEVWEGDEKNLLSLIVSLNWYRRNLDKSQRAMIAANIAQLRHGQKKADAPSGASQIAQTEAAEMMNVGRRSLQRARELKKSATPETIQAVVNGELPLNTALTIAKEPVEEQNHLVALPRKERDKELKEKKAASVKTLAEKQQQGSNDEQNIVEEFKAAAASIREIVDRAKVNGWSVLTRDTMLAFLDELQSALATPENLPTPMGKRLKKIKVGGIIVDPLSRSKIFQRMKTACGAAS